MCHTSSILNFPILRFSKFGETSISNLSILKIPNLSLAPPYPPAHLPTPTLLTYTYPAKSIRLILAHQQNRLTLDLLGLLYVGGAAAGILVNLKSISMEGGAGEGGGETRSNRKEKGSLCISSAILIRSNRKEKGNGLSHSNSALPRCIAATQGHALRKRPCQLHFLSDGSSPQLIKPTLRDHDDGLSEH